MEEGKFELVAPYKPTGDQPRAIEKLTEGVLAGRKEQALLGVTGSGKTFTMANVIANVNRPTLVLAHNKTLAAQLCSGVPGIFPAQRCGVFCQLLRLLPAGGLYRPHGHLYRKGFGDQRRDREAPSLGDRLARRTAGRDHRVERLLHLHAGRPDRLPQHGHLAAHGNAQGTGRAASKSWWRSSTSATTSTSCATSSGSAATLWRSSRSIRGIPPCASNSSGTRSTASPRSTR